jgi:hypothetical protein
VSKKAQGDEYARELLTAYMAGCDEDLRDDDPLTNAAVRRLVAEGPAVSAYALVALCHYNVWLARTCASIMTEDGRFGPEPVTPGQLLQSMFLDGPYGEER